MAAGTTRDQITAAADRLFYERGFEATSFADIAAAVNLSRGNFYYHFKSKDEILAAVIARRVETTRAALDAWAAAAAGPADGIRSFIGMLVANRAKIMRHGCPVGTLCAELAKLDHAAQGDAAAIFTLFRTWLADRFAALGHGADADALALHALMRSQGIAALATALHDEAFIDREVEALEAWLDDLPQAPARP
ncbi:transcriptional regulator [Prosthecomicrobium hirschii]|uniref:Transcriptional regulator n=1 Tax=Prosthecodimorpha hirschii TaxID=665126 RepID=A0A0P6VWN4_9HYPH|nr:TetR/AcrR family transcriptional regulator [Prosthecomicrobium hirschii]KPL51310.1 transcriptional regulator [Prosthecomicrobium hirschii]TPQ48027.1 TetR/AcrR family transcriptional regulator [Prosthecomicrobium hirschii]